MGRGWGGLGFKSCKEREFLLQQETQTIKMQAMQAINTIDTFINQSIKL